MYKTKRICLAVHVYSFNAQRMSKRAKSRVTPRYALLSYYILTTSVRVIVYTHRGCQNVVRDYHSLRL